MSQLTDIIIKSGIIPENVLNEVRRWGLPTGEAQPPNEFQADMPVQKLCDAIDEAIQSEGYVLTRETDLEAIGQYLNSMTKGSLHVVLEDESTSNFEVHFGRNAIGEFIIPWRSDSITDLLTNGETYLKIGKEKVFFSNARELFYGNNKAFVVCTPSAREPDGNRQ